MEIIRKGNIDPFSVEGPDGGACGNCTSNSGCWIDICYIDF